jgi:hypothetical protein
LSRLWKPVIIHSLKELIAYPHEDAQTVALWLIFRLCRPRLSFAITLSVSLCYLQSLQFTSMCSPSSCIPPIASSSHCFIQLSLPLVVSTLDSVHRTIPLFLLAYYSCCLTQPTQPVLPTSCFSWTTLKTEAVSFSEMSVTNYQTIWFHTPECVFHFSAVFAQTGCKKSSWKSFTCPSVSV